MQTLLTIQFTFLTYDRVLISLERRQAEAARIREKYPEKYPDRIPVLKDPLLCFSFNYAALLLLYIQSYSVLTGYCGEG